MKIFLSTIFLLVSFAMKSQTDITPKVVEAFKKGDAAGIGSFMMNPVDINVNGKDESLGRDQAVNTLTKFFTLNQVKGFELKHQGTSKLDDQFRIGELQTGKGTFRVTFFMKKVGAAMQIKQLTIEAGEDF